MIFKGAFRPKLCCDLWTSWVGKKRGLLGVLTVTKHELLCYLNLFFLFPMEEKKRAL